MCIKIKTIPILIDLIMGFILLIWRYIKEFIKFLDKYTSLGVLFIGLISLLIVIIRIMETLKIKKVYGEFERTDQGTKLLLSASIVYTGFTVIDITDIKIQINHPKKMFCFLEGEINKDEKNKNYIVTTKVLNYSNKEFKYLDFNIPLTSNERHLKILNTYLSTDYVFNKDFIEAKLIVKTDPNFFIKILNYLFFWNHLKRTKKFQFKRVEKIKNYEKYYEIPLLKTTKIT